MRRMAISSCTSSSAIRRRATAACNSVGATVESAGVELSAARPHDDCSTGTQVSRILNRHAVRSRVHFECFDVERIHELIEEQVPFTSDAPCPHYDAVDNNTGAAFAAVKHRPRSTRLSVASQETTLTCDTDTGDPSQQIRQDPRIALVNVRPSQEVPET